MLKKVLSITQTRSYWVPQLTHTGVCHNSSISFFYVICCTRVVLDNWQWNSPNMNFGTELFSISKYSYSILVIACASIHSSEMLLWCSLKKEGLERIQNKEKKPTISNKHKNSWEPEEAVGWYFAPCTTLSKDCAITL